MRIRNEQIIARYFRSKDTSEKLHNILQTKTLVYMLIMFQNNSQNFEGQKILDEPLQKLELSCLSHF